MPVTDPLPSHLYVRVVSDRWVGVSYLASVSLRTIILPETASVHTDLLDLKPLPVTALNDKGLEEMYSSRFTYFNPI